MSENELNQILLSGKQGAGEQPVNAYGKRLFPLTLIMVACDQCGEPRAWPLTCGHNYVRVYSVEYRHVDSVVELERERDALKLALINARRVADAFYDSKNVETVRVGLSRIEAVITAALGGRPKK